MPEMFHPALPDGQTIDVPDVAVPHHRGSGWQLTSERDQPAEPAPAPEPAAPLSSPRPDPKPTTANRPKPDGSAD